jgi:hypothetical protein
MKKIVMIIAAWSILVVFRPPAKANTFDMQGVNYPDVGAEVSFLYVGLTNTSGQVMLQVANTSSLDAVLTAFAFNLPSNITGAELTWAPNDHWKIGFHLDEVNTPGQFGLFDVAAVTGPNFNGGSPNYGITNGNSGQFVIKLLGTGMAALTDNSFLSIISALENGANVDPQFFITRFQRVNGDGSDVAIPRSGGDPVPEPATIILLGTGLAGIGALRRKKK